MDELPLELINKICDCLAHDIDSSKNLRLSARKFLRTEDNIFRSLVLYQHPDKWKNVDLIAKSPHLAKHVHVIKLVRERCLPTCSSFEAWRHDSEDFRQSLEMLDGNWYPVRRLDNGVKDMDDLAYEAYKYWYNGYQDIRYMWHFGNRIPPLCADKLTNLHKVETIGHTDLCKLNSPNPDKVSMFNHKVGFYQSPPTRQEAEALITLWWRHSTKQDQKHMEIFLTALNRCRKTISHLTLHDIYQIIIELKAPIHVTPLKKLEIDLTCMDTQGIDTIEYEPDSILRSSSNWHQYLNGVETLSLAQGVKTEPGVDLITLFGQWEFPRLKTLVLKRATTPVNNLREFIRRHDSLVSITIEEPLIVTQKWNQLREEILNGREDGDVFVPKEGTKLVLTDSFSTIHQRSVARRPIVPEPPAESDYWDYDDEYMQFGKLPTESHLWETDGAGMLAESDDSEAGDEDRGSDTALA